MNKICADLIKNVSQFHQETTTAIYAVKVCDYVTELEKKIERLTGLKQCELLEDLVKALDSAFICGLQSTSDWDKQLDAARQYIEDIKS